MKQFIALAACAVFLPGAAVAASRTYDTAAFESVSVSGGLDVDITIGSPRSVVAETGAQDFGHLQISVEGNVLRIGRPGRGWFSSLFARRPSYRVRVVTPVLRTLTASSGSEVSVRGVVEGDFTVKVSSGSEVEVSQVRGNAVRAQSSSGSELQISGTCLSLEVETSSGSEFDGEDLQCETGTVRASSGSDVSVRLSRSVAGRASSGSNVTVRGNPAVVQVEKSSGADVDVRN